VPVPPWKLPLAARCWPALIRRCAPCALRSAP